MDSKLPVEFKENVISAIKTNRQNYGGSNAAYAKTIGLNEGIVSNIFTNKNLEGKISDANYLRIGRQLGVNRHQQKWNVTRTAVYDEIEDNLFFCQTHGRSMILVDDCGIGKTFCAKHIVSKMKNAFYIDCSQTKTKFAFIKALAKTIGLEAHGKFAEILEDIKYYITVLDQPLIVLDEAGDLEYHAFLEIKSIHNATVGACGWYMMGAQGLRRKIKRGVENDKIGYAEIFSRFSDEFVSFVPTGKEARTAFYSNLIGTVAMAQVNNVAKVNKLIKQCLEKQATLRKLETLIEITRE